MKESEERARAAARALTDAVNEMGFDVESFADEITRRTHRTLQQNAFGAFLATIKAWAGVTSDRRDARNEWTCLRSREIVEMLGEYNLRPPYL